MQKLDEAIEHANLVNCFNRY